MKLVSLRCPSCGADLKINSELKNGVCNFCGYSFIIDDEIHHIEVDIPNARNAGFEFEQGRIASQESNVAKRREEAKRLATKIRSLIPLLEEVTDLIQKSEKLSPSLQALEMKCKKACEKHIYAKRIIAAIIILTVPIILRYTSILGASADSANSLLPISVCICVFLVLYTVLQTAYRKSKLSIKRNAYQKLRNKIYAIFNQYDFDIVPKEALSSEALEFIAEALNCGRAYQVDDAMLLYESYCSKKQTAKYQKESLRLQAQLADEAAETRKNVIKGSVIAGGSLLVAGWKIAKSISKKE